MKKIGIFILILIVVFIYFNSNKETKKEEIKEEKGVFISYIDYNVLKGKNKDEMSKEIAYMIKNIKDFGLNSIILQTNPFNDAIYQSEIYQSSHIVVEHEGDQLPIDILETFIEKGRENNISIYAWMNPYRIRNKNLPNDILIAKI